MARDEQNWAKPVKQLEAREEESPDEPDDRPIGTPGELPRGEDVVRQLEEFLRERQSQQTDDDPDPDSDDPPK